MPRLPAIDQQKRAVYSSHVVILGAGASRAAAPSGDANGRRLPLVADFVDVVGLAPLLDNAGVAWRDRNFEEVYDGIYHSGRGLPLMGQLESAIRDYFRKIELRAGPTAYDYLLLSLREKDMIATFNWDPFLLQAYGRYADLKHLPQVAFLHGNVSIGFCLTCKIKGGPNLWCRCGRPLEPSRLLYPVREKDYSGDPFIATEWDGLRQVLEHAYFLTIFGYSAPTADAAAVEIMKTAWAANETRTLAEIEIIDIRPRDELERTWSPFITRQHYGITTDLKRSYLTSNPRRSCEALAFATLMLDPWPSNPIPDATSVADLRGWVKQLLDEEDLLEQAGVPFSGKPSPGISNAAT